MSTEENTAAPTDDVVVKAVKTFEGEEGFKTPESDEFTVSRLRYADLKANGLVLAVGDEPADQTSTDTVKQSDKPANKQAQAARNK